MNFASKYLVNDVLHAKCDAPIRVEVIDRATGQPVTEALTGVALELCILDGNQYDARCAERAGEELENELDSCMLLLNNKAGALLSPGNGGTLTTENKVLLPLNKGVAVLPEVFVSDSSEALLSGRKPPFRLLARAITGNNPNLPQIRSAVSEGFVVATRRTRTAGKVDIPNVDDSVSKLEHMGRETVKKLQDIRGSALAAGIDIQVPDNCVSRVGEFRKLALLAEADGHLRQKLQQVLKLSKEKWDEARDHAMRAVVADNRMRIWYADKRTMDLGLLFICRLGSVELDRPVGLLTKKASDGAQTTMEATLMAQQTPAQRDQVRSLQPQAAASWWQPGHPGWAIYPVDSDQFLATGALDTAALSSAREHQVTLPVPVTTAPLTSALHQAQLPYAFNPLAGAFIPGVQPAANEAILRAISGSAGIGGGVGLSSFAAGLPQGLLPTNPNATDASPFASASGGGGGGVATAGGGANVQQQQQHQQQQRQLGMAGHPTSSAATALAPSAQQHLDGNAPKTSPRPLRLSAAQQQQQRHQQQHAPPTTTTSAPMPDGAANARNTHTSQQHPQSHPDLNPPSRVFSGVGGGGGGGAGGLGLGLDGAPSFTLANLQSMFGSDLSKLPFNLQKFPSLPGNGLLPGSGDLEALLQAGSGDAPLPFGSHRLNSLAFAKSIELVDADPLQAGIKVEMNGNGDAEDLSTRDTSVDDDDKGDSGGGGATNGGGGGGGGRSISEGASGGNSNGGSMQRKNSGLESMQSIEHALAGTQREHGVVIDVHSAMDAAMDAIRQQQEQQQQQQQQQQARSTLIGTKRK